MALARMILNIEDWRTGAPGIVRHLEAALLPRARRSRLSCSIAPRVAQRQLVGEYPFRRSARARHRFGREPERMAQS